MVKPVFLIPIFIIGVILVSIFFLGAGQSTNTSSSLAIPHTTYDTKYGAISISIPFPETPENVTLYRVEEKPNDSVFFSVINIEQTRSNVTPESEAPFVAEKILDRYGGLPNDSKISLDETQYLEGHSGTGELIAKFPISTSVQYTRVIDGHQISGDGGYIALELGTDGELLYLDKVWRTVIPNGTVHVIPASEALERMERGEILGAESKCGCVLNVNKIILTYRENGRNVTQKYLDPVWVFAGTLDNGDPWNYQAYAWNSSDGQIPE